jgi:hypothetical protein
MLKTRSATILVILALAFGSAWPRTAAAAEAECHVRFVSAESVYLDAGSAAGLDVGVKVRIVRGGKAVAELEVAYVAEHSASCRIISGAGAINTGDRALYEPIASGVNPAAPDTLVSRVRTVDGAGGASRSRPRERLDGWVALQWDHTSESTDPQPVYGPVQPAVPRARAGAGQRVRVPGTG